MEPSRALNMHSSPVRLPRIFNRWRKNPQPPINTKPLPIQTCLVHSVTVSRSKPSLFSVLNQVPKRERFLCRASGEDVPEAAPSRRRAGSGDEDDDDEEEEDIVVSSSKPPDQAKTPEAQTISKREELEHGQFEKLILAGADYDDLDAEWRALKKKVDPIRESYYDGSAYDGLELPPSPMKTLEDFSYDPLPNFEMSLISLFDEAQMSEQSELIKKNFTDVMVTGLQSEAPLVKPGDIYFAKNTVDYDGINQIPIAIENGAIAVIYTPETAEVEVPSAANQLNGNLAETLVPAVPKPTSEGKPSSPAVDRMLENLETDIPIFSVTSVSDIMSRLGCIFYGYPSSKLKLISVVGSRGKTSVVWILHQILHEFEVSTGIISDTEYSIDFDQLTAEGDLFISTEPDPTYYRAAATPYHLLPFRGRYRIEQTVPDPLQVQKVLAGMAYRGAEACVIECPVEAIHDFRLNNVDFDVSVFLNQISEDTDTKESFETKKSLNGQLFSRLDIPKGQRAIINIDDPQAQYFLTQSSEVPVVTYSLTSLSADIYTESIVKSIWETEMVIVTPLGKMQIITPLIGEGHIYNILASTAAAISMDIQLQEIVAGIEALDFVPGRCELIDQGQDFSVVVDSANTPAQLKSLIRDIRNCQPKRIFLVIGCSYDQHKDMRAEIGSTAYYEADIVLLTTDQPGNEDPKVVISDMIAGFPKDLLQKTELWVIDPWQDPGRVPWWFEEWLFRVQSEVKRHVVEDRGLAIRGAIGTAKKNDVIIIAGRGDRDHSLWIYKDEDPVLSWFDDSCEVRDGLTKLPHLTQCRIVTDKIPWTAPKDASDRKRSF